jgi:hypothetical protein
VPQLDRGIGIADSRSELADFLPADLVRADRRIGPTDELRIQGHRGRLSR